MKREEIKDIKLIMKILDDHAEKTLEKAPILEGMEERIIDKLELVKLRREVKILKKLEYSLVLGMFLIFVLFFPWEMKIDVKKLFYSPGIEGVSVDSVENLIEGAEKSLSLYLEMESELDPLSFNEDDFSGNENYW